MWTEREVQKSPEWSTTASLAGGLTTVIGRAAWVVLSSDPETYNTDWYFTSMLEGQGIIDDAMRSLHIWLSEMDTLLWPSPDFSHESILDAISRLPQESQRITYIEWLILRSALVIQSLNKSMETFLWWGTRGQSREILISTIGTYPIETILDTRQLSSWFTVVVWTTPANEKKWWEVLPRIAFPIYFSDECITKDARLAIPLGADSQVYLGLKLRYPNDSWRDSRFLRLAYWEPSSISQSLVTFLHANEQIKWVINTAKVTNGTVNTDVFDQIVQKIQALLLQVWDIGELLNTARDRSQAWAAAIATSIL